MANYRKKSAGRHVVAVMVAIVAVLGAAWGTGYGLTGEANPVKWATAQKPPADEGEDNENGGNMDVIENNGILLCAAQIPQE